VNITVKSWLLHFFFIIIGFAIDLAIGLDIPAFFIEIAIAWACGFPDFISVLMLADTTALLFPDFKGMTLLFKNVKTNITISLCVRLLGE
jgi:hypothetical protein